MTGVSRERLAFKAKVIALWNAGGTMNGVAEEVGISRNAVAGILRIAGDAAQTRGSPIKRDGVVKLRGERPVPLKVVPTLAELLPATAPPAAFVAIKPIRVVTRAPAPKRDVATCFWPIGDPSRPSFHSCDAEAESGKPYCAEHCRIAYVKSRPLRDEAA